MISHWLDEAQVENEVQAPILEGNQRADVCIVGGGYTGLWTALELKSRQPALDVALVEARYCGSGASGRNGGFVATWWAKFQSLQNICGAEEAVRLARASAAAVDDIGRFCEQHEFDAHYRRDGWLWTATSKAQIGAWTGLMETLERFQEHPFVELSPDEVIRRSGSDRHLAGVFERSGATVQPALLARGLRRVALKQGVRVFEHSPMVRLVRSQPPLVVTPKGGVKAEKVVLALNVWSTKFQEFRRAIAVVGSDIVLTAPFAERLKAAGWADGLAVSDSRMLLNFYRTTRDGRIAFGTGGGMLSWANRVSSRFEGESPRRSELERRLRTIYPSFLDVPVVKSWTGPIDRTVTGLPFFGRLGSRPDLLFGVGFSGNGVGPTRLGGRILASLVLESEDEWSECGLVRDRVEQFPPEPVRYFGGNLIIAANRRKERLDDSGRRVDRPTAYIAGLAPAGYVPVKKKDA